ncbi:hypothetical protein NPIL_582191 [Nephila pilipes]|uniref:Uncharacterized protein n=1 Tax=Nephila pilipes TaxID=299642 RepID=A0A8X6N964_NEPPI|nr:hypothetical protein NPIL_582191 [Nephila pilipes]
MLRCGGPYLVLSQNSPTSCVIANLDKPSEPIAICHAFALAPLKSMDTISVVRLRKRGPTIKGHFGTMRNSRTFVHFGYWIEDKSPCPEN